MRTNLADIVHPIIHAGLALRERGAANGDFESDVAALKQRLGELDPPQLLGVDFCEPGDPAERDQLTRATIRYALVCWLDELMTNNSNVGARWRERSLETEVYGAGAGPVKFWDEARYAETRSDVAALEVMFLCVNLGFRGAWRDKPDQIDAWLIRVNALLAKRHIEPAMPACLDVPARASARLVPPPQHALTFTLLAIGAIALPAIAAVLWRSF
jgi:type VI secretion system protein ImpK